MDIKSEEKEKISLNLIKEVQGLFLYTAFYVLITFSPFNELHAGETIERGVWI